MPEVSTIVSPSVEVFNRRHPTYNQKLSHWLFLEATYKGGREWFEKNIHKYIREGDEGFKSRLKRAYRFNHTREIVDLVTKYVFKSEIHRDHDNTSSELHDFWKKTTRGGDGIDVLMRQVDRAISTYGQAYVVVDNTLSIPEGSEKLSRKDIKDMNSRCYAYIVRPQDALDMAFDDHGDLLWFMTHEVRRDDTNWMSPKSDEYGCYRIWTRSHSFLFQVKLPDSSAKTGSALTAGKEHFAYRPSAAEHPGQNAKWEVRMLQQTEHNLGVVPVIPVRERESESPYDAPGLIDDIAYLDRAVANYLSNLDAIIQDQTFSTLTLPIQAVQNADSAREQLVELGTKQIFTYDGEAQKGPEYISPDASQAELILSAITKIITEIYHSVGMAGERTKSDNAAGIDNSSGVAKAYDFDRMNTLLKAKADRLAEAENRICKVVMKWWGSNLDDDVVKYSDDFDTRSLYDDFDVANRLTLLDAPDALRRYQFARLIDKLFPHLKKSLREEIDKTLENEWPQESDVDITQGAETLKDRTIPESENVQGQSGKTEQSA